MEKKAVVIGSGIAGLASAVRLAIKGFKVEVFEANTYPGGKLSEISRSGYRFDAGPSLFTLPEEVDELFRLAGKNPEDYFVYKKLDITCQYFWEDGTRIRAFSDVHRFVKETHEQLQEPKENIYRALEKSAYMYEHLSPLFMKRSLHRFSTWVSRKAFSSYLNMGKLGIFGTMDAANRQQFQHPKLVQLFNRYATYNGSNPYQTPATLNIIPHLEFNRGAFFPVKGMHDITNSVFTLAQELGVKFHFNTPVQEILVDKGKAVGVLSTKGEHLANVVVNNMDMVNAYKTLLKKQKQPKKLLDQPKSSSALIFYWGIKKVFPELGLHNIFFSEDYRKEFEHIFAKKAIYEDPTVYINITSTHKPDDAPEGGMNWFTMINVPNDQGQDWDTLIASARKNIIAKINRILGTDISAYMEVEDILEPRSIATKTGSSQGALYGNSSNNRYAAFLRHANYSPSVKNLYFCGGSVHPGGGIPLCLLSAKIMSEMVNP
ncbi:1-hydroxycarotenoid 3,4-desaturase CrtD [Pleomorphovibrio marinus]|uniref:1-hydroxycarotenoid 3,4-desaturase CrtD n=1 Tax=Pleomorphovibrio marinus TaxID=2164132 RepID=UPI000E0A2988|nr:1-hydroxycarotenoid 3,4-desaturase CrtD [Pleomorphovibrio marinus]